MTAGVYVIATRARSRHGLATFESDALIRSSTLNRDRVERINESRESEGGRWVDRFRIVFFGVWMIALGAIIVLNAID